MTEAFVHDNVLVSEKNRDCVELRTDNRAFIDNPPTALVTIGPQRFALVGAFICSIEHAKSTKALALAVTPRGFWNRLRVKLARFILRGL